MKFWKKYEKVRIYISRNTYTYVREQYVPKSLRIYSRASVIKEITDLISTITDVRQRQDKVATSLSKISYNVESLW